MVRILLDGGYAAVLWVHLGALALLTAWNLPSMVRGLGRGGVAALLAVAGASAWLATVQPARPQVFHDEFFYTAAAQNLKATGRAEPLIWQGLPPEVRRPGRFVPPYPQGWPFTLSLALPAGEPPRAGVAVPSPWEQAVTVARGLYAAGPPLLFLALAGRFGAPLAAAAALCLAGLPPVLKLSGTAAADTGSLFALCLSLAALAEFRRRPDGPTLAWLVLAVTWAGETRPEDLAYGPLFLAAAWPALRGMPGPKLAAAAAVTLGLILPPLVAMGSGSVDPLTGHHFSADPRPGFTAWGNRAANLGNNALFFLQDRIWPLPLTVLALAGLWNRRERPLALWAAAWGVGLTLFLSWFPFGDYASVNSYDTWRFSHHVALPGLLLGTCGAAWLVSLGRAGAAVAALLLAWAATAPLFHRGFLEAPHPLAGTVEVARAAGECGWAAAEAPETFVLLRYGLGLPAVLGPVREVPREGLCVYALEDAEGLPDLPLWSPLELEPVLVEQGAGIFRARDISSPQREF